MQTIRTMPADKPVARISALRFQRNFGEAKHRALREPVEITRHGRREFVLMTTDHYDGLMAAARRMEMGSEQASRDEPPK